MQPAISTRPALKRSASDAALDLTPYASLYDLRSFPILTLRGVGVSYSTEDEIRRPDLKKARVDPSSDTDECIPACVTV